MAVKTCIQQKYAIYDFKQNVPTEPEGPKNVSLDMTTKSLQSNSLKGKSIPDGRVTKLITHADTLNTEILTMQEDDCRNQRIKIKLGKIKKK